MRVWNVDDKWVKLEIELKHDADIYDMSFSPDGKWLVVGNKDSHLRLWDWRNRKMIGDVAGQSF